MKELRTILGFYLALILMLLFFGSCTVHKSIQKSVTDSTSVVKTELKTELSKDSTHVLTTEDKNESSVVIEFNDGFRFPVYVQDVDSARTVPDEADRDPIGNLIRLMQKGSGTVKSVTVHSSQTTNKKDSIGFTEHSKIDASELSETHVTKMTEDKKIEKEPWGFPFWILVVIAVAIGLMYKWTHD